MQTRVPLPALVVRLAALGDILRTIPAVRLLKSGLPQLQIRWVVDDRWSMILEGLPELEGRIQFPRKALQQRGALRNLLGLPQTVAGLRRELRQPRAALLLDFHGNLRSGLIGLLSGSPVRLGHDGAQQKEGNRWLTTNRVAARDRRTPRSRMRDRASVRRG